MSYMPHAFAAEEDEAKKDKTELEEVQVTGSRIVRKDIKSNSPTVTVDRERLEDNGYISIEQALNEMPQFMAGGAGLGGSSSSVGQLVGMEGLDGGAGSGTMFDNARLPDNGGRVGTFTPGAANVNLRGLGTNRSLTLIDGHRGQPNNATGTVDLNTIPSAAIASIEVVTGGASAVYGADALAGVTNIKLRDNFEGISVRLRGGVYEVGDGGEYQVSSVLGTSLRGKGNAMVGIEYSKRDTSYYANRSWYREVMESPFSSFLNYSFPPFSEYRVAGQGAPSQTAVNGVFADRNCTSPSGATVQCISATAPPGGGFMINRDGTANYVNPQGLAIPYGNATLFTRSASCLWANPTTATPNPVNNCAGQTQGITYNYGPQGYVGDTNNSAANPYEVACTYVANFPNTVYPDRSCAPSVTKTDWERWLGSPREAYTLFGRAKYEINDSVRAYSTINFATSKSETRREVSPASGGFAANIPYNSSPTAIYLPSVQQTNVVRTINGVPTVIIAAGATLPEYVSVAAGGTNTRGTNCPATGGCTMVQAFPVPTELRTLLNSRVAGTRAALTSGNSAATNPFQGLSSCVNYARNLNPAGTGGAATFVNPTTGVPVTYAVDPNTGQPVYTCGPNATWSYNNAFDFLPARGTINTQRTWSLASGLEGDLPFKDWTWDLYTSVGEGQTNTEFQGFVSLYNYRTIMSQPNYGKGYAVNAGSGKSLSCTSGLSPFSPEPISADCIEAVASNQMDRQSTMQRVHEFSLQGGLFELPAGEVRTALGLSYRKNTFVYTPDSLRERDYINDTSAGQFGVGSVDAGVSVKEVYGELLIPLLRDLPFIQNLELELGGRWSEYSTGQNVPTWKALVSWQPVSWIRARGGFNRAERAPNIAELYTKDSVNANGSVADPCVVPTTQTITGALNGTGTTPLAVLNDAVNPNRAKLQALCAAMIARDGGNASTEFNLDPNEFGRTNVPAGGLVVLSGNPNLKSEKGSTWTAGLVFSSPFENPLLSRMTATFDWFEARIDDPIDVPSGSVVAWACFNAYGDNPNYDLNDPDGYCSQLERDPAVGGIRFANTPYLNRGKLIIRGLDASLNWSGSLADMGFPNSNGRLSVGVNANFLFDQIQALAAGGNTRDNAGIGNAAPFRSSTNVGYSWGVNRVSASWQYRSGTCIGGSPPPGDVTGKLGCATGRTKYPVTNTFSITGGTRIGAVNASLSVTNPLNTKPRVATYLFTDPTQGYGTFNPFDDITGRRYSLNLSMDL